MVVGLTGGIGSGKSTAANIFKEFGIDCIDADNVAKNILDLNENARKLFINEFGDKYIDKDIFIIGGSQIIKLTIDTIQEFYLTRIYGNYDCEKFLDISMITNNMKLTKKIKGDKSCHFEIWKR